MPYGNSLLIAHSTPTRVFGDAYFGNEKYVLAHIVYAFKMSLTLITKQQPQIIEFYMEYF